MSPQFLAFSFDPPPARPSFAALRVRPRPPAPRSPRLYGYCGYCELGDSPLRGGALHRQPASVPTFSTPRPAHPATRKRPPATNNRHSALPPVLAAVLRFSRRRERAATSPFPLLWSRSSSTEEMRLRWTAPDRPKRVAESSNIMMRSFSANAAATAGRLQSLGWGGACRIHSNQDAMTGLNLVSCRRVESGMCLAH